MFEKKLKIKIKSLLYGEKTPYFGKRNGFSPLYV